MNGDILIAPSILSADFTRLGEEIQAVEAAGADWIHVDVMDGHFVPNLSMGPAVLEACRRATRLPLDVHLMVEEPERMIGLFADAGADSLTVHVEATPNLHRMMQSIHALGLRAGVSLNPGTPVETLTEVVGLADLVLVMSVNPGYSGQTFIRSVLPKVRVLREWHRQGRFSGRIEIDGGIGPETIRAAAEAGADVFVASNAVFKHPDGVPAG
jgi:ribulose-phosphate 3-epimerase